MHGTTFLTTALLAGAALAAPNMGPPKPKKTMSLAALNDCGCDIPAFFIQECQNIPSDVSSTLTQDCVCDRQWYGYSDLCSECVNNALKRDEFPELVDFMDQFTSATKQLYSACTLTGGSVRSDGNSVCAHTYYGDTCISIAADGKSGWASFEASTHSKVPGSNATATFELAEFKPAYKGQTLDVPKTGYPKAEEKKEDKKKDEGKDDKETEGEEEETTEDDSSSSSTSSGSTKTTKTGSNSTVSAVEEGKSPVNVSAGGQTTVNVKHLGFAAVFGLVLSLLV